MHRTFIAAAVVALASASVASAASVRAEAHGLGLGASHVDRCDDTFGVTYAVAPDDTVTGVTVTGIAPACAGGLLHVVVVDAAGAALGAGDQRIIAGTTTTHTVTPAVVRADVAGISALVVGP